MKELIANGAHCGCGQAQSRAETVQTALLPGSAAPIADEIGERFIDLSLNGNDREFAAQTGDHHQVRLAVAARRS